AHRRREDADVDAVLERRRQVLQLVRVRIDGDLDVVTLMFGLELVNHHVVERQRRGIVLHGVQRDGLVVGATTAAATAGLQPTTTTGQQGRRRQPHGTGQEAASG